jgi:hypothetical protein
MTRNSRENPPAKYDVIRERDSWSVDHPDDAKIMNGMIFFTYLEREKSLTY